MWNLSVILQHQTTSSNAYSLNIGSDFNPQIIIFSNDAATSSIYRDTLDNGCFRFLKLLRPFALNKEFY